ncbi:unnamed protein product, partial [Rotaria magnacalcarata]
FNRSTLISSVKNSSISIIFIASSQSCVPLAVDRINCSTLHNNGKIDCLKRESSEFKILLMISKYSS